MWEARDFIKKPLKAVESFRWMTDDFKTQDAGKNTIHIKGIAVRSDTVSRNGKHYVDEELQKSARTWANCPITINHDPKRVVGNVIHAEYEDGAIEYLAKISKEPYVKMLRDKSAEIRGVSIEADYLSMRCPKCNRMIADHDVFVKHMEDEHFIKNSNIQPRGIVGRALSLVLSPEEPGVTDTTIELLETVSGVNRLFEAVCQEHGILYSSDGVYVGSSEQQEATPEYCREHPDDPRCVKAEEQEAPVCKEGTVYDPETMKCIPVKEAIEKVMLYKHQFEKLLTIADENAEGRESHIKTLELRLREVDKGVVYNGSGYVPRNTVQEMFSAATEIAEQRNAILEKTLIKFETELKQRLEAAEDFVKSKIGEIDGLTTRLDNWESKLKPQFKGRNITEKQETAESDGELPYG